MGQPIPHKRVKLIIGFIFKEKTALTKAQSLISKKMGSVDSESEILEFYHTDYYKQEFGEKLKRKFVSLKRLVLPEDIYRVKLTSNKIEHSISKDGKRLINIDPGYITESKLVLLTTKDYSHRIYLRKGIYAEITLKFQSGTFRPLETTYPDYKCEDYIKFFNNIRAIYRKDTK
ncbi:MAG: DUF4416 family protein [Candidatus Omnitrophica bacterium]|nr:DUF4416 family protein [Candidatus Omnitrophota bacterium]